jgi:hypothetical protein
MCQCRAHIKGRLALEPLASPNIDQPQITIMQSPVFVGVPVQCCFHQPPSKPFNIIEIIIIHHTSSTFRYDNLHKFV